MTFIGTLCLIVYCFFICCFSSNSKMPKCNKCTIGTRHPVTTPMSSMHSHTHHTSPHTISLREMLINEQLIWLLINFHDKSNHRIFWYRPITTTMCTEKKITFFLFVSCILSFPQKAKQNRCLWFVAFYSTYLIRSKTMFTPNQIVFNMLKMCGMVEKSTAHLPYNTIC